jgi:hypothetical protein
LTTPVFLREGVVDIDAAVVGISSARWTAISSAEASLDIALRKMKADRSNSNRASAAPPDDVG